MKSMEVWGTFEEEFDTDIAYRRPGYLFLVRDDETAERFEENVRKQNEVGMDSELLDPDEAAELCPELSEENFMAASYSPADGFADPHLALQGFSTAADAAGVDIRTKTEAVDIRQDRRGRVTCVETDETTLNADYVVNAAGPWAAQVAELAGVDLPISPKRRQLMVADPDTPVDGSVPFTIDQDRGVHFRPERNGAVVCGGHFDEADPDMSPDGFPKQVSLDWSAQVIEGLSDVAEYFRPETVVKECWAGLYSMIPDHHPIIEETIPGFVVVAGFSGHGFMQSLAAGQLVTAIIVDGSPSLVDISSLTSNRFERGTWLQEGTVID